MGEKRRKFPLTTLEMVLLAITLPVIFYYSGKLLWEPINSHAPNWFFSILGLLAILGFDCAWIALMKLWPLKKLRVKIYMTLFILTISAVLLTCSVMLNMLSNVW
jgi:hypothetical protein